MALALRLESLNPFSDVPSSPGGGWASRGGGGKQRHPGRFAVRAPFDKGRNKSRRVVKATSSRCRLKSTVWIRGQTHHASHWCKGCPPGRDVQDFAVLVAFGHDSFIGLFGKFLCIGKKSEHLI